MTEEASKELIRRYQENPLEVWSERLTEKEREEQYKGEAEAIKILLGYYRSFSNSPIFHSHTYPYWIRAERLDMLSCICEFLQQFTIYRFDTKTERLCLLNDGKPHYDFRWRYEYTLCDKNYDFMKERLHLSLGSFNKAVDRREGGGMPPNELAGMRRVGEQVEFLVDNYRSYSVLIKNDVDGAGLGPDMYRKLNMYRESGGDEWSRPDFG